MDPEIDRLIRSAIEKKRLLRLHYKGSERIVKPHDYGMHKGVTKLLAHQREGFSSAPLPNWRWIQVDRISELELLQKTFPGGRPTKSGKHHNWDELFIRVKPADTES